MDSAASFRHTPPTRAGASWQRHTRGTSARRVHEAVLAVLVLGPEAVDARL